MFDEGNSCQSGSFFIEADGGILFYGKRVFKTYRGGVRYEVAGDGVYITYGLSNQRYWR